MNGETTFLDEFNATAPDLSREVNVMVVGGSGPSYELDFTKYSDAVKCIEEVYRYCWAFMASSVSSTSTNNRLSNIDTFGSYGYTVAPYDKNNLFFRITVGNTANFNSNGKDGQCFGLCFTTNGCTIDLNTLRITSGLMIALYAIPDGTASPYPEVYGNLINNNNTFHIVDLHRDTGGTYIAKMTEEYDYFVYMKYADGITPYSHNVKLFQNALKEIDTDNNVVVYDANKLKNPKIFDVCTVSGISTSNIKYIGCYDFVGGSGPRIILNTSDTPNVVYDSSDNKYDITGSNAFYLSVLTNSRSSAAWFNDSYRSLSSDGNTGVYNATQVNLDEHFIISTADVYYNGNIIIHKTHNLEDLL